MRGLASATGNYVIKKNCLRLLALRLSPSLTRLGSMGKHQDSNVEIASEKSQNFSWSPAGSQVKRVMVAAVPNLTFLTDLSSKLPCILRWEWLMDWMVVPLLRGTPTGWRDGQEVSLEKEPRCLAGCSGSPASRVLVWVDVSSFCPALPF